MSSSFGRIGLLVALLLVAAALLLFAFAWPGVGAPWRAAATLELEPSQFLSGGGPQPRRGEALRIEVPAGLGVIDTRQALSIPDAAAFRYFAFDAAVDSAMQLFLVWQGSEGPGRAPLPRTPSNAATLDLSRIAGWKGRIDQIGIQAVPADYLPAAALPAVTLELRAARLESVNLRAAFDELATQWLAYRPWTGRSNNTGGSELAGGVGPSLTAASALLLLASLPLLRLVLGAVTWRVAAQGAVLLAGGLLALWQVAQLGARAHVAHRAERLVQAHPGMALSAQPSLAAATDALSRQIEQDDWQPRMLTFGAGRFLAEYPAWLLRRYDVASLAAPEQLPSQASLQESLLVLVGVGDWRYAADRRELTLGTQTRTADLYFDAGLLRAYYFDAGEAP
jgi:hypothetical protein